MLDARYLLLHQALGLGKMWLQKGAGLISASAPQKNAPSQPVQSESPIVKVDKAQQENPLTVTAVVEHKTVVLSTDLTSLAQECIQCQSCALSGCCKSPIFGQGNTEAKLLVFSACPTPEDDLSSQLFFGETGQLLSKMLAAINIAIESVYLTNAVKCSGGFKMEISPEHYQNCMPYLERQIELIKPKAILALGTDLETWGTSGENGFYYQNIPYFVIPHPARLIRHPGEKKQAWEILQKLEKLLLS